MTRPRTVGKVVAAIIVLAAWALPGYTGEPAPRAQPRRHCPMSAFVRHLRVQDGVALVEAGGVLCAVDPATLGELWRTRLCPRGLYVDDQRPRHVRSLGLVLVWRAGRPRGPATELALEALEIRSGRPRWRYDVGPLRKVPAFHVASGVVLLMEGRGEKIAGNQHLACLELATGKRRWKAPDVRSLAVARVARKHFLLGYGPQPRLCDLATGRVVEWATVPEGERAALQRDYYYVGKVRCSVTELWRDEAQRIVHINAREFGGCGLYFGRDVILRARHGEVVNPDKPERAIWCFRPPNHENAARVVGSVACGESLVVLMNPIMPGKKPCVRAYCLNRNDGAVRWRLPCDAISTPAVLLGKTVLFGAGKAVSAVDVDSGRELWTRKMQGSARHRPVVVGSVAVFGDEGGLVALDAAGRVVWQRRLAGGLRDAPVLLGKRLLVASAGLSLLDGATGKPVVPTREVAASAIGAAQPVTDGQAVYVLTRSGRVHAVDRKTLSLRWRVDVLPAARGRFDNLGSLGCGGETVAAAAGMQLVALRRDTGTLLWRKRFTPWVAGLACTGKQVIALADKAYAFDANSGALAWQFKPQYGFSRYGWYLGDMTPLALDGRVYFTDWFVLYCLDATTGAKLWATRVGEGKNDRVFCMPAQHGTRFLYTSRDHGLYSADLASGQRRRMLQHAPCLGGHDAYGIVGGELYWPTTYLDLVRVLSARDGAELAAIRLNDRAISPLVALGKELLLGGQRSVIAIDPRRRAVARTIATGHPAPHLLPSAGALLVVDQGLKEYR